MSGPAAAASDLQLAFYDRFFFEKGLEPYPIQERAFDRIFAGESVLVTVPTGSGKTVIAKGALHKALASGQTAVYTTPLRALTEEKFRELQADFGEDKVGFATGDYKVNREAPIQVVVAEILWNQIYGDRQTRPADVVVMDEGHYFNDAERGYVWEQSIIGLDPRTQLVILSATVGDAQQFCTWVYQARKVELALVESLERRVPLLHEYREEYLIETIRDLDAKGDTPAIVFVFGRDMCFEKARIIKSCRRFTSDEERDRIAAMIEPVLAPRGLGKDLKGFLLHGIGIHHAGILPRYKQLVEALTLERLCKIVVSTETISAGINLPAKRVVFPELKKVIKGKPRLLLSSEYHQMAGRAGRPQFDTEGIAITLAPEEVVQQARKEIKDKAKGGYKVDEAKVWKSVYSRIKADAQKHGDVTWDQPAHAALVAGKPAALKSQTRITAEQILAIGLPDLKALAEAPRPTEGLPVAMNLHIYTVIDHLLLGPHERLEARRRVDMIVANLQALGVLDEHGQQVAGKIIGQLRGVDGPFIFYYLMNQAPAYEDARELVEFLVDHDVIHKKISREGDEKRREWIRNRLRERRREESMTTWEDVEAEYERLFPRELSATEKVHQAFLAVVPHQELHGGKVQKAIWKTIDDEDLHFYDYVERHGLEGEEGNLWSYLARVMKVARMLKEVTALPEFEELERRVRKKLGMVDDRVLEDLWFA